MESKQPVQEKKYLSLHTLRTIAVQLAREHGVLHRDIKLTIPYDLEPDARNLPGFLPYEQYNSVYRLVQRLGLPDAEVIMKPLYDNEIGRVERFVIVTDNVEKVGAQMGGYFMSMDVTPSVIY